MRRKKSNHFICSTIIIRTILISSSNIQTALITESIEQAVAFFYDMAQLTNDLNGSQCTNLVKFVKETTVFWYKILRDKLVK